MDNRLISIGLGITLTVCLGLLSKVGCDNMALEERTSQLNTELMKADLDKGRAETEFGEAKDYIKELEDVVQNEIKARRAEVTRYGKLQAQYDILKRKKRATKTKVIYKETDSIHTEFELVPGMLYQAVAINDLVILQEVLGEYQDDRLHIEAKVIPYPNQQKDINWEFGYKLQLKLEAQIVETLTPSGAINHYVKIYELDREGNQKGEFKIQKFRFVVQNLSKSWFLSAHRIDVGILGMIGTLPPRLSTGASIGVSVIGYGRTKKDLDWRFGRLTFDLVDGQAAVGLSPVVYNLGQSVPLITNLWIGPHVNYSIVQGEWRVGLWLGASL